MTQGGANDTIWLIQWQIMYDFNFSKQNSCSLLKKFLQTISCVPRGSLLKKGDQTTKLASFDTFSFVLHIFIEKTPAAPSKQFLQAFFCVPGLTY